MGNYCIQGKLTLEVCLSISAKNLDEALEKSKKLKVDDFVEFKGDFCDGNMKIVGIFEESV